MAETGKGETMRKTTKEWYALANSYEAKEGRGYAWLLDYAKFRLQFTFGNGRYIEEKSLELFKVILAIAAVGWAAFSWLLSKGIVLAWPVEILISLSVLSLLASGALLLKAFSPSDRPVPLAEDVALRAIEKYESGDRAIGNFSLTLTASTERQSEITCEKGKQMRRALWFIYFAVAGFTLSLFLQMFLKTFPLFRLLFGL
jgi:hypothetical protein